ncbi:MAG: hypothetical protein A2464_07440 [Deltaproteobacteria bacterium RIFOXYC2_FULL_48_10]|nr:MAG: hypothetical protein A2464_07440 [Deltaproteobacteria bacterium RIFOXYC2_FULL_48_10]
MTKAEFLNEIEKIIEVEKDTLKGSDRLDELENWDSFALMELIAMIDNNFAMTLEFEELDKCKIIDDIYALLSEHVS